MCLLQYLVLGRRPYTLVVIRTAKVIAALGADELAVVAGEPVRAVGADLAVVVDRQGWFERRTRM